MKTLYNKRFPYVADWIYVSQYKKRLLHIVNPMFMQNYWILDKKWKGKDLGDWLLSKNCKLSNNITSGNFWYLDNMSPKLPNTSMCIIWFSTQQALVHEISHATYCLLKERGIEFNDERMADSNEWLFDVITTCYGLIRRINERQISRTKEVLQEEQGKDFRVNEIVCH